MQSLLPGLRMVKLLPEEFGERKNAMSILRKDKASSGRQLSLCGLSLDGENRRFVLFIFADEGNVDADRFPGAPQPESPSGFL